MNTVVHQLAAPHQWVGQWICHRIAMAERRFDELCQELSGLYQPPILFTPAMIKRRRVGHQIESAYNRVNLWIALGVILGCGRIIFDPRTGRKITRIRSPFLRRLAGESHLTR